MRGIKRPSKRALVLLSGALVIILILIFVKSMGRPAVGTINTNPENVATHISQPQDDKTFNGNYINFSVPDGYRKIKTEKLSGAQVELVQFYSTEHLGREISVGVQKEALQNESGYLLRVKQPQTYKRISSQPPTFVSSSDQESQIVCFISHGELLASIAITAPPQQDLKADVEAITNSLQWKR